MNTSAKKSFGFVLLVALLATGVVGSEWCYQHHVCMAGHMAHPPYAVHDYIADSTWTIALLAIPFISQRLELFGRWWWVTLAVLALPFCRFVLERGHTILGPISH